MPLASQKSTDKIFRVAIPKIHFPNENSIRIGSKTACIDPESRQAYILKYFYTDPKYFLPKNKLIDVVHQDYLKDNSISFRHEFALWQSSTQVMCRLRRTLTDRFKHLMPIGTEWLPYSEDLKGWILYKLPAYGSDGGWH